MYLNISWFTRIVVFCMFMVPAHGHVQVLGLCPSSWESLVLLAQSRVSASALWSTPGAGGLSGAPLTEQCPWAQPESHGR